MMPPHAPRPETPPAAASASRPAVTPATSPGAFRLFRLASTDVFLHWSWFVVAYFMIQNRWIPYSSMAWDVAEYVALFGLVLLHEFGHVLACRQVGGSANRVVLWPLGGLAFVAPPPRPAADLWTTAAGPLVNLVLAPLLIGLAYLTAPTLEGEAPTDLGLLLNALAWINGLLLVFNLLPIFPMDGGRILQALLWFVIGRSKALAVAAILGIISSAGLCILTVLIQDWWLTVLAAFLLLGAIGGLMRARTIAKLAQAERREMLACPNCKLAPPIGPYWLCNQCVQMVDQFALDQGCPKGGEHVMTGECPECGFQLTKSEWVVRVPANLSEPTPL